MLCSNIIIIYDDLEETVLYLDATRFLGSPKVIKSVPNPGEGNGKPQQLPSKDRCEELHVVQNKSFPLTFSANALTRLERWVH